MANYYHTQLRGCFVKPICITSKGVTLKSKWLIPYGLNTQATLLITPNHLVITNQPEQQQQMMAIQELLYRQDETHQDFSLAINTLVQPLKGGR